MGTITVLRNPTRRGVDHRRVVCARKREIPNDSEERAETTDVSLIQGVAHPPSFASRKEKGGQLISKWVTLPEKGLI